MNTLYRSCTRNDILNIVDIHREAFPEFYLTSLGNFFLESLYNFFLNLNNSVFIVCELNSNIIGFAVGQGNIRNGITFNSLKYASFLIFVLILEFLKNPYILFQRLSASLFEKNNELNIIDTSMSIILRSICVHPKFQRLNCGANLIRAFEESALTKNFNSIF